MPPKNAATLIRAYHDTLAQVAGAGARHEGPTRNAFGALLAEWAAPPG